MEDASSCSSKFRPRAYFEFRLHLSMMSLARSVDSLDSEFRQTLIFIVENEFFDY